MLKQHRFLIPAIVAVIILFSVGGGWWLSLPRGDELPVSIRIVPSAQEDSGIVPDAAFAVTSGFNVTEESLRGMLELDPPINYTLAGGRKDWTLQPVMPLLENTVYTIRVRNAAGAPVQSFAFQTRSDLLVESVFPGDRESYVDVKTGIEIRFNRPGADLSRGFSILPAVSGRFETQNYSCRFIPDRPLEYNSVYRITLRDLRSGDGAVLMEPFEFSFETMEEEGAESWDDLRADSFTASFLPDDEPRVLIRGGERQAAASYTMTLHKYAGIKAYEAVLREHDAFYRDQYGVKEPYRASVDGLDEVMNTEGTLMKTGGGYYAPLPADLSEGYYLFTLSGGGEGGEQFVQQMIQVVNLSVYTVSVDGRTMFWLGDPVTGNPAGGARVELETEKGKVFGETDADGLVRLEPGEGERAYATVIREATPVWFDAVTLAQKADPPLSRGYYAAIYTDREIYLPGDAIRFWGVVKPRNGQEAPKTVRAALSARWPESRLAGIDADVAEDGTFSGVLTPGMLQSGGYFLSIGDGGDGVYLERYVEISEYTKPAYEITLSTDKDVYYYGDTVTFHVSAKYYDGTPAAGAKLVADCYDARLNQFPVTLDENGEAAFRGVLDPAAIQPGEGNVAGWEPQSVGWSVQSSDAQAVNLSQWHSFTALPSRIAAELTYEGAGTLSIETAVLDESKLDAERTGGMTEFQRLRGVPADLPMTLVVHKVTYRRIQTGSWYDYVNKQNVPVYETKREETVDRTIPVTTAAGKAVVSDLPVQESDDVRYWFELRFAGGVYGDVCVTEYPSSPYQDPDETAYAFLPERGSHEAAPGETLDLGVYVNGVRTENTGAVLYALVQDGFVKDAVFREDESPLAVEKAYMPNIWLVGAYFDGKAIHPMEQVNITCDYAAEVLEVEAVPERTEYRPGEEVKVTLSVKDAQGRPVSGRAAVGVVDEAVFAVAEQRVNLAGQLYGEIYYPNIAVNTYGQSGSAGPRWKAPMNTGAREDTAAMEAGGGASRSVFADTAAFQTADVRDGTAQVTLKLPDNVTSWRVTAAAVTPDLKAGDTTSSLTASMPFYLRPIVTGTYLAGDDVSVSALAVGTALAGGAGEVSYTAVLTGGGEPKQAEKSAPVGTRAAMNLGQVEAGDYEVTISAEWNGQSDSIKLPLTVADTGLLVPEIRTMALQDLTTLKSARWPVEVTVFDEDLKPAYDTLAWLSRQGGLRTEAAAASARAAELYQELRPADAREPAGRDPRLTQIEGDDGGIVPLPGAQSDASLTARMLMAAPELCHPGRSVEYLRGVLKDPAAAPDSRIMAYVGLAAAREPVLLDLQRLYESEGPGMEPYLRLYVGAAFARLGDFDRAREIYEAAGAVRTGELYHIEDGNIRRATGAALLLASEAGLEDAGGLAEYLMTQKTEPGREGALCNLELLAYAKRVLSASGGGTGKFTYYRDGEPQTQELEDGMAVLTLGPGDIENKFRSLSGSLYAAARVLRPGDGAADGGFAQVTKTYEPAGGSLVPGGQVKVTLRVLFGENAPYGVYELADYIPSGLRWLGGERAVSPADASIRPMLSQDGQRITGTIYRSDPSGGAVPLDVRVDGAHVRMLAESVENQIISGTAQEPDAEASSAPEAPDADSAAAESGSSSGGTEEPAAEAEEEIPEEAAGEEPAETDPEAAGKPAADTRNYAPILPKVQENPNEFVFEYYLSAALPGNFVTESVWITLDGQAVKSDRGLISVGE